MSVTFSPKIWQVSRTDTGFRVTAVASQIVINQGGGGGGSGTVTSVTLSAPSLFTVAGSPVTTAGTLALSFVAQAPKTFLAGPDSGANAAPTMRTIAASDLPANVAVNNADNNFSTAQTIAQVKTALITSTGSMQIQAGAGLRFLIQDTSNVGGIYFVHSTTLAALVAQSISQTTQPEFLIWGAPASGGVNGGNLVLQGGTKGTGGTEGSVVVRAQSAAPSDLLQIQDSSKVKQIWVDSSFVLHGDGSALTNLNAANLAIGTLPDARLSANVPLLTAGKLATSVLPALAISEFLGTVASQAAMVALVGQRGDWCIRTDDSHTYFLTTDDPTQAANWQAITTPGAPVAAVNGHTGNVTLAASDVGAQPADAELTALAGLTSAADQLPYFTGSGAAALTTLTAAARTLLATADSAGARTALGLGTLATKSTVTLTTDVTGTLPSGNLPTTVVYGDVADIPHRIGWVLARGTPATTGTNKAGVKVRMPYAGSFKKVWIDAGTGPTGASLIVDIKLNGTSIWAVTTANRPTIADGATAGTQTAFDTTTFAAGDYLAIDVAQVGSTVAGQDIAIALDTLTKNQ